MKKFLIWILFLLICNTAHSSTFVKRFPTDTAVLVCQPNDTDSNCAGGGGGGSGNVGIGTTNYIPQYVGIGTLGPSNIVDVSGNVGIGSPNPQSTLDVGTGTITLNSIGINAWTSAGNHIPAFQRGIAFGKLIGSGFMGFANGTYNPLSSADANYFKNKGLNIYRLSTQWEYWQSILNGALDPTYSTQIQSAVSLVESLGGIPIIDIHNFGQRILNNTGGFTENFSASSITSTNLACPFTLNYTQNIGAVIAFGSDDTCYSGSTANPTSPATGYADTWTFKFVNTDSNTDGFIIQPMRNGQGGTTYYEFQANLTAGTWYIHKVLNGVTTTLTGGSGSFAWATNTSYAVKIDLNQTNSNFIDISVNGTPLVTNGTIPFDGTITGGDSSVYSMSSQVLISGRILNVNGDISSGGITGENSIDGGVVTSANLANLWSLLSTLFVNDPIVMFEIQNEPQNMPIPMSSTNYIDYGPQTILQLVPNTNFAGSSSTGWNLQSDFTVASGGGYSGDGNSGGNNVAQSSSGSFNAVYTNPITVTPSTTYTVSMYYKNTFTSSFPQFNVYASTFGGTLLLSNNTSQQSGYTRVSYQFSSGANTSVVIAIKNNGGAGTANYDAFNLTPTSSVLPFSSSSTISYDPTSTVTTFTNLSIAAIRQAETNIHHWIIVPFDQFNSIQNFSSIFGSNPKIWWYDLYNKVMLSAHSYFDDDYSGTYQTPFSSMDLTRIPTDYAPFLAFTNKYGVPQAITEIGIPNGTSSDDLSWQQCYDTAMSILDNNQNNIVTYWAAQNGYTSTTTLEPTNNYQTDAPQMPIVLKHLGFGLPTQSGTPNLSYLSYTGNVGIGSQVPSQALDVQGTVRAIGFTMTGQTPVIGYVLTASDSSGDATWSSSSSGSSQWTGTNPVYMIVGTNVGIGSAMPGEQLDVNGTVRANTFMGSGSGITGAVQSATTNQIEGTSGI